MIRNMLMNAEGRKIALIINEFGDLGVDGDVLKGCGAEACTEDDIIELNNGCICCTVADDFIPTMEKLLSPQGPPRSHHHRDVRPGAAAAAGRRLQLAGIKTAGNGRWRHYRRR
jgi:hypothetical protein